MARPPARTRPGRVLEARLRALGDRRVALLLVAAFALAHLPFRSEMLVNWDAVNFALGIRSLDLGHHQPHAPGYIGYVALGRLLARVLGDANAALTTISVAAGGALTGTFYLLARRLLTRRFALVGTVLLGTSPVVWYYSSVALTYIVGAALAVGVAWAAHTARIDRSRWHLHAAAVLLALLGAVRQTDLLLLLPVGLYAAAVFPWRERLRAGAWLTGLSLLWFVPLLWSTGGLGRYVELSGQLAELAGGRTWVLGSDPGGILQNVGLVGLGLVLGLGAALVVVPVALVRRVGGLARLGAATRRLLGVWVAPAAAVFLLVHTGQLGYVLLILPVALLWATSITEEIGLEGLRVPPRPALRLVPGAVVLLAVANVAASVVVPGAGVALLSEQRAVTAAGELAPEDGGIVERTRQYALADNDRYWSRVVSWIHELPADRTTVLALPTSGGSFRQLTYYTPTYRILGVGRDREGTFGALFSSYGRRSSYSVAALDDAQTTVRLPPRTQWVVVPDRAIRDQLDAEPGRRLRVRRGPDPVALRVPPDSALRFERVPDLGARVATGRGMITTRITVVPRSTVAPGTIRTGGPSEV